FSEIEPRPSVCLERPHQVSPACSVSFPGRIAGYRALEASDRRGEVTVILFGGALDAIAVRLDSVRRLPRKRAADDLHRFMVLSLLSLVVSLSGWQRQSARRLAISWAACSQPDGWMTDARGMKDEKSRALSSDPRALCDERERAGAGHDLSRRGPG